MHTLFRILIVVTFPIWFLPVTLIMLVLALWEVAGIAVNGIADYFS